jgi:hypothetical protein
MQPILANFITDIASRWDGPLHFRFILQPIMASLFALRDGRIDAQKGRPPYGWTIFTSPEQRQFLIKEGWQGISKVFILGVVLDIIYQLIALRSINLITALEVGCLLAIIPYGLLRGVFNRLTKITKQ